MSGNSILEYSTGSKITSEIFRSSNTTSEDIDELVADSGSELGEGLRGREVSKERDNWTVPAGEWIRSVEERL